MSSTIRVNVSTSVIRLTPPSGSGGTVILRPQSSVIKLSQVGIPGPQGGQGDPGQDGEDGQAQIPEIIDGGNF